MQSHASRYLKGDNLDSPFFPDPEPPLKYQTKIPSGVPFGLCSLVLDPLSLAPLSSKVKDCALDLRLGRSFSSGFIILGKGGQLIILRDLQVMLDENYKNSWGLYNWGL